MATPLDFMAMRNTHHRGLSSPYPYVWVWTVTADMVLCENVPKEDQGEMIFDPKVAWALGNAAGLVGRHLPYKNPSACVPAVRVLQCPDRRWAAIISRGDNTSYIDISPEREAV